MPYSSWLVYMCEALGRRSFLQTAGSLALAGHSQGQAAEADGVRYVFSVAGHIIKMTVNFFDHYTSSGFAFRNSTSTPDFCLSAEGRNNSGCLSRFDGALAIAQYQLQSTADAAVKFSLRELVRAIDADARLALKPPSERVILFNGGLASDIQAFGVEPGAADTPMETTVWCVVRQDLFFNDGSAPFLVMHWKHTAAAIRLLDVIPVGGTRLLDSPRPAGRKH